MTAPTVVEADASEVDALGALAFAALDLDRQDAGDLPAALWSADEGTRRIRLVTRLEDRLAGVAIGSIQGEDAFLDLILVDASARRRGHARALLREWEAIARDSGVLRLRVGANLHSYAWPGVDIRYTAALCLFLREGYGHVGTVYNMDLALSSSLAPGAEQLSSLGAAGVTVRRAEPLDVAAVVDYARRAWSEVWAREMADAIGRPRPTAFVAVREDRIVGFSAYGVNRRNLYGPIATDPEIRGLGVGDVLSRLCLADLAAAGEPVAQIGWVAGSAIPFYSHTVGARLGRCFWTLEKSLVPSDSN